MSLSLTYPQVTACNWKPLGAAAPDKNIFRNPARSGWRSLMITYPARPHRCEPNHRVRLIEGAGETLTFLGLSIGLLTLFAGLSLL